MSVFIKAEEMEQMEIVLIKEEALMEIFFF